MPLLVIIAAITAIPAVYQGRWSLARPPCAAEDTEGVMIGPYAIDLYEAHGSVMQVSEGAKGASAKVAFTREARNWTEGVRFRIPGKDQMELRAVGTTRIYWRCS